MTIMYSVVARDSVILCSHQIGAGNFEEVVRRMLPNIPTTNDTKSTYTSTNYLFNIVIANGITFLCTTDPSFGKRQPFAYLSEIQERFLSSALASRANYAMDGELNRDFAQVMAGQMERYSRIDETDNVSKLRAQVEDVKGIMTQNIEKVMERGDRLEDLVAQTDSLEAHSQTFVKTARKVQRKMWWKNTKMTLCLIGTSLIVILILILIILFSTHVLPPKHDDTPATTTTTTTTTPVPSI